MSAQGDCEFLVQRARELVQQDLWAAKAWLITARSLYPADFNIQVRSGRRCGRLRGDVSLSCAWLPGVFPLLLGQTCPLFSRFSLPPVPFPHTFHKLSRKASAWRPENPAPGQVW